MLDRDKVAGVYAKSEITMDELLDRLYRVARSGSVESFKMATGAIPNRPADNRIAPPSALRRHGSQLGIIGVGLAMWLAFVAAAPAVFTNLDIYRAFAQTTPQFGIIALALTFVVITGEIDLSFPSIMALGVAAFCLATAYGRVLGRSASSARLRRASLADFSTASGRQAQHSLAGHHHRDVCLYRGLELVLMNGTGVPLTADKYPEMHALLRASIFGVPVQTLWMIGILAAFWVLLNRTRFGAHVFLVGDNPTSARLMGVNAVSVKARAFVLVGMTAVFSGLMTSIYGYYFWPTTGDGFLLNTIASVFLGGTSVFGGTGSSWAPSSPHTSSERSTPASSRPASTPFIRNSHLGWSS